MSRPAASDRVARMLSLVPWVAAQGRAPVAEICRRFDIDREQLLHDLSVVSMVGLYPYTPDVLIELFIEDDEVYITLPQAFDRPLSLTPEQGVALVAAGATILAAPGADPAGPLARGLAKLSSVLDQGEAPPLQVRLEEVSSAVLEVVQRGVREHHQVSLDYYAYGRDELTHRVVDPYRVTTDQGQWYLSGYCHLADGDRLFRIDRIRSAELLATSFDAPTSTPDTATFSPSVDDPRVTIDMAPEARWVVEQYPVDEIVELGSGALR
ncbi:MAG TPA: WYL domain-containing protein, partial [Acidimicrobiales bacterium]